MASSTARASIIQHISVSRSLFPVSRPTSPHRVSTVINQPLAPVLAHLRSVINGTEGRSPEADPTMEVGHPFWGRSVCIRYTVYAVPGGTQVTAAIESLGHGRLDPITSVVVRVVSGRIATGLSRMRDAFE